MKNPTPARLPGIVHDGRALFYVCPCCNGNGAVLFTRATGGTSEERWNACEHCFGFGRLPVPGWYREQTGGTP